MFKFVYLKHNCKKKLSIESYSVDRLNITISLKLVTFDFVKVSLHILLYVSNWKNAIWCSTNTNLFWLNTACFYDK